MSTDMEVAISRTAEQGNISGRKQRGARSAASVHRLSREESQKRTRARLIQVAREHFLEYGLGGAVAERIAEAAGYSRGALYSNFTDKEDLFIAVMQEEHERYCALYNRVFRENLSSERVLKELRATYIDMLVNPEWVILWAELQTEAVRNDRVKERYWQFYSALVQDGIQRITELVEGGKLVCRLSPSDFVLAMSSFSHGLAMRQRVLGAHLPEKTTRRLIGEMFNTLISTPGPEPGQVHKVL